MKVRVWFNYPQSPSATMPEDGLFAAGKKTIHHQLGRQLRRCVASAATLLAINCALAQAPVPRLGVKYPGLPAASHTEAVMLGKILAKSKRNVEISLLMLFNPSDPFTAATTTLETIFADTSFKGSVTVDIDLVYKCFESFSSSLPGCKSRTGFDWDRFTTGRATDAQRDAYLRQNGFWGRQDKVEAWAAGLRSNPRVPAGRIHLVVTPFLEDDAPTADAYAHFLDRVDTYFHSHGGSFAYRRTANGIPGFRPGNLPLEVHGSYQSVKASLTRSGDIYSPDGTIVDLSAQQTNAAELLTSNKVMLYWVPDLNANTASESNTRPPDERGVLTPLSTNTALCVALVTAMAESNTNLACPSVH